VFVSFCFALGKKFPAVPILGCNDMVRHMRESHFIPKHRRNAVRAGAIKLR